MTSLPLAILLGQLLGTAIASGINLYVVITLIGLASRFGWTDAVPYGLRGLENGVLIGSAVALYVIEFVVDKVAYVDSVWDAVHTIVRPVAAGLLAVVALDALPPGAQVAGGIAAAAAALVAHATKAGLRVSLHASGRSRDSVRISLLEDVVAVALVASVLLMPVPGAVLAALVLLVLAVKGPPYWRAAVLGIRSVDARIRGFFGTPGWRERDDLPGHVAALVEPDALGLAPPRALRAAAHEIPGAGTFRNGWLLIQRDRVAFIYRAPLRARRYEVPAGAIEAAESGLLVDTIRLGDGAGFTLFLLKDGPPLDLAVADLKAAAAWV
jgi:hypothetical protein